MRHVLTIELDGERIDISGLIYLATPYSKFRGGIDAAFDAACLLAATLITAGLKVYSPVVYTHPIARIGRIDPLDHEIWLPFDQAIMGKSDLLLVAEMDGWAKSFGVAHEIAFFTGAKKPVLYLDPESLTIRPTPSAQILKFPGEVRAL